MHPDPERYDVIVLGGAFAGAAAALLLRREAPALRVLVVEKQPRFDEKVGEATTEMSGMFLTRRLALWQHLEREHLPKEGLRYWFSNQRTTGHADASETGGFVRSAIPSFQLRRDALDEHILSTAVAEGAELLRPVRVRDVELGSCDHAVTVEHADGRFATLRARWVLDATGRATFLGKKLGLIERNDEHPTAALWCRWRGVRHIDDLLARHAPARAAENVAARRLATNHYMGFGYWIWVIPLGGGETSIGVVWDKRLLGLHERPDREAAYLEHLRSIPALAELLEGAAHRAEDFRYYSHLPYVTRQYMGEGWALIGDAAAFLDPYYSPGLDHAAFSVEATVSIVAAEARGTDVRPRIARHNEEFLRSYRRFFRAIFKDKYFYMGEHDLLSAAMLMDTAQYYVFVVTPAYRIYKRFHWQPVLGPKDAFFAYYLMVLYNRRLKKIALLRREMGEAGRRNDRRRIKAYFNVDWNGPRMGLRGAKLWLAAEADALRLRARRLLGGKPAAAPVPAVSLRAEAEPAADAARADSAAL